MSNTTEFHKNLVDEDLHKIGYVQSSDPGAIGSGKAWVDISGGAGNWLLKLRNESNTAFEQLSKLDSQINPSLIPFSYSGFTATNLFDAVVEAFYSPIESVVWGDIGGTLSEQEDLTLALASKEPLLPETPENPEIKYLNGNREWATVAIGAGGFAGNLYFTTLDSDVSGYKVISYDNELTETVLTATISNQEVLARTYLFPYALATTVIDGGVWIANYRVKVSGTQGVTQLKLEIYVRHTDNTETTLFSAYSPELNNTDYVTVRSESNQPAFSVASTDRLGARVYVKTTASNNITISTVIGDGNSSYFTTPLRIRHNQLRDLNGDNNYLHVTSTEKTNWNTAYGWGNHASAGYFNTNQTSPQTVTGSPKFPLLNIGSEAVTFASLTSTGNFAGNNIIGISDSKTAMSITDRTLYRKNGSTVSFDFDLLKFPTLTSNGFLKTGSGNGTLSVDTNTYLTSVTAHNLLSTTHGDTTAGSVARGSIITGQGATPKWTALALPSTPTGKILTATATDVAWSQYPVYVNGTAWISGENTGDQDLTQLVRKYQVVPETHYGSLHFDGFHSTGYLTSTIRVEDVSGATYTCGGVDVTSYIVGDYDYDTTSGYWRSKNYPDAYLSICVVEDELGETTIFSLFIDIPGASGIWGTIEVGNLANYPFVTLTPEDNVTGTVTFSKILIQPYETDSTTLNVNLNADLLDGFHASSFVPYSGATGNVNLGSFSLTASNISGTNTGDQDLSPYALKLDYLALNQSSPQTISTVYGTAKFLNDGFYLSSDANGSSSLPEGTNLFLTSAVTPGTFGEGLLNVVSCNRARGTLASPLSTLDEDFLGGIFVQGYGVTPLGGYGYLPAGLFGFYQDGEKPVNNWNIPSKFVVSLGDPSTVSGFTERLSLEADGTTKLGGLTSNGFVKTISGDGTLTIDTNVYLTSETDPVFVSHPAYGLTTQDMTDIGNLSGVNTGDQDLSGYLKLDQTTPQTVTGLSDGYLKLTSGVIGTGTIDTSALVAKTDAKTIRVDGDFYGMYLVSAVKKITVPDLGYGYTITNVKVQASVADPTTEFRGDLKWCDAQGTGAFPSTNPTVIKVMDTTTGNYDSGAITEDVATGKELYIQMDSNVDYGVMWTITVTYNLRTS